MLKPVLPGILLATAQVEKLEAIPHDKMFATDTATGLLKKQVNGMARRKPGSINFDIFSSEWIPFQEKQLLSQ